ncbi:hypothetical protein OIDMADRAFT_18227 [Oidiodendron maius Zn]|uniref:Uncharacterized protein n=1 Tax=Oidiodendron maius (strain Zn) TaxID=913774 RepID=A0A0C3H7L7_OIDMZ|nr:hypothetical protein OIDMADRAFT_18227 [Oidiodendron maius Zn]
MAPAGDLQLGIDTELDPETKQGSVVPLAQYAVKAISFLLVERERINGLGME